MDIQRGMRGKLFKRFDSGKPITVSMKTVGAAEYDCCCFGVDGEDQLSDDRYMVFYNQTQSPNGEIAFSPCEGGGEFAVQLTALPDTVRKLVFTVSIDGEGTMGQIERFEASVAQEGSEPLVLTLAGSDFAEEKAIISLEMYIKGEWRYCAVAQGFNGGLSDLLEEYGGEEAAEPDDELPEEVFTEPEPVPAIALEKPVAEPAPEPESAPTIALEKPAEEPEPAPVDLEKPKAAPEDAGTAESAPKVSLVKLGKKRVNLQKNDQVGLINYMDEPITHFIVGLGWDVGRNGGIDCDASAFLCRDGVLRSGKDIVCFTNLKHDSGAVVHTGDNLTGAGSGDDERIIVDLMTLPPEYDRIVFVANIFLSRLTREHFGMVKNGYIRICDQHLNELCCYSLSRDPEYDKKSAMIFGEVVRYGGIWVFRAIGMGTKDHSIRKLAKRFKK